MVECKLVTSLVGSSNFRRINRLTGHRSQFARVPVCRLCPSTSKYYTIFQACVMYVWTILNIVLPLHKILLAFRIQSSFVKHFWFLWIVGRLTQQYDKTVNLTVLTIRWFSSYYNHIFDLRIVEVHSIHKCWNQKFSKRYLSGSSIIMRPHHASQQSKRS